MTRPLKFFAGRSHLKLAEAICQHLGIDPGKITFTDFPNENIKIAIEDNVRECDVFVMQTACPPLHDRTMELLVMIDALKYASAARITAVIPYYMYARSDKKDKPRISITARLVADLLEAAGCDRILTMNLHSAQTMGFARIPVDQLDGIPILCDALGEKNLEGFVAVAPDVGRGKVVEAYARRLGLPVAILGKERIREGKAPIIRYLIGEVGDRVLFFDDEILTGGSILAGVDFLKRKYGSKRFLAACVHGVLGGNAIEAIEESDVEELWITDSVPLSRKSLKIKVCSVAKLFADAIKAIHTGSSVSALFQDHAHTSARDRRARKAN